MRIDADTRLCAVIGDPVRHSLSPAIHNAAFEALGLNYVYVAFRVEDVGAAVAGMRALENFEGLSVTIPHKVSVMRYLDEIDDITRSIGSVNTVVKQDGRLKGITSDGPGALKALADYGVEVSGRKVLLLGSGGAARAISFALATLDTPPHVSILGIVPDELERLGEDLKKNTAASIAVHPLDEEVLRKRVPVSEVIIHCTPVGMHPNIDDTLIRRELLRPDHVVFDIVYNPKKTRLLREAEAVGCVTIPGLEMFVNQAVVQFELWTGQRAPVDVMRNVVEQRLGK
ncbi:MAG: shikimate dehydrogenase [Candidatus Abyssubacteria bacterium]